MSDSKKKIIQKLGGSSARQIYNALVQIRTNIIKSKGGIEFLVAEGAIPKLIQLIGKSNCHIKGTIDIIFSILGNLCMNDGARKNVEQNRGISVIAEYFCECKTESIQNRSCRTLANLALSPSACEAIHQTEVTGKIVTLLKNTENKECQLTYCRAISNVLHHYPNALTMIKVQIACWESQNPIMNILLGRTLSQIEKLLNHDAVSAISKLLGCDDNEVKAVGLRALFELSKHGCSCQFANQVIGADIIKDMLNLSGSTDKTISHHAFSLIFKLIDQSEFRPPFGSAGGITLFINLLESDLEKGRKISVVNGLCLCSKEVVNRSKMRENGGLVKFLHFLQDNEMHIVHDRVISALLCYLYDDQSINILLENNVVSVLIGHLQRVAKFESYLEDVEMSTNDAIGEGAYREDMDEMNMGNEASYGMLMDLKKQPGLQLKIWKVADKNQQKNKMDPPVTEGMSLRVKVGLSLLHDLFIMANSPFGRGIIAHWFARKETAKKLQCAVCLLYITWYSGMQQFYFFKLKILDDLLQILLDRKPVGLYNITLNGLVFLGKNVEFERQT
ncbi:hypothetical protein KUTeg_010141 [Tegillarca granosa]|uniref:ARMC5-like ARM-repeats domain-containing protein n=1 Tax=Tegillarca granosa TaxID=220873 RepID=A0ABQ9F5X5_TEGGR|nr:hypothetical protein KUTeg_010141 [Tegillarca granosa]